MPNLLNINRYPGIRSFERAESGRFFGRSRETAELFSMVKVKPLTVLFAKSGIGKTSLLNAGLAPLLEQNGYLPVKLRLQDTALSPVETVKKVLAPWLDKARLNRYGQAPFSLWEYVRSCRFEKAPGETLVPVFVFDQFEELFNHPLAEQQALTLGLADLINERLPDAIQTRFRTFPRQDRSDELLEWFSPVKARVVFAIRADRMGELDRLKHHIPTVLHDRFYLKPLDHPAAREAIVHPARLGDGAGIRFFTPPFEYTDAALEIMLHALENDRGEVESFQLQILCQHIEKTVAERKIQAVAPADFGGSEGISRILNDYYEREIGQLLPGEQTIARRFIEEGLIVNGRRVGVPEGAEQAQFGVETALLGKLLDSRLVRAEIIHLGKIYELSHDTLVDPVLRSYEQRRIEEERAEAARALEEQRTRLRELGRKRRRARLFAIAGFSLAALALAGGLFAWFSYRAAEKARKSADVSALAAKAWELYRDDHTLAFRLAEAAWRMDSANTDARQTLRAITNTTTTTFYATVFTGHRLDVESLAFSPDGKLVASGSFDNSIAVWKRDGSLLVRLDAAAEDDPASGHSYAVRMVAFAPDGQSVWSAGQGGWVKRINLEGRVIGDFAAHARPVWDMALAPDGQWLVTASDDSTAAIWTSGGQKRCVLRGHCDAVRTVSVSPDGKLVLSGSADGTARIWSAGGALLRVIELGGLKVNASAFSPDGRYILLGCSDNTARLYTISGQSTAVFSGHTAEITEVAFMPDGASILTASNDHTARLWRLSGEELLRLVGHAERVSALGVSSDGQWVATGGFDFTAKIWNIPFNLQNKAAHHKGPVTKVAISPDGRRIVSAGEDNTVKIWSLAGVLLHDLPGHRKEVTQINFIPPGNRFFSTSLDGTIRIWDTSGVLCRVLEGFPKAARIADFAPAGNPLLAAASGPEIFLFDSLGRPVKRWETPHAGSITRIQFSPDGQRLLSAGADGRILVWNTAGMLTDSIKNETLIHWASFSPDGQHIAAVGYMLSAVEWQIAGGAVRRQYLGHYAENYFVGYSPDGRTLLSGGWDKTARLWDRQTGEQLQLLPHPDGVNGAAFSADGRLLATACRDKYIRIWEVATGRLRHIFGDDPDVGRFMYSENIAQLEQIPFKFERYSISPEMAVQIYGDKPARMEALGIRFMELGIGQIINLELAAEDFQTAERFLAQARYLSSPKERTRYDSLIGEVYVQRSNLFLSHRKFPEMLSAAQKGLSISPLPMLKVYETFGLLLNGKYGQAERRALQLCADTSTVVNPAFGYDTYRTAFSQELYYYEQQMGITHPDFARLAKALE
ncbi:MAG: WD40 repeat domain-containing protein [Saprospirales bacterium]|nr:WD40 repeat domain-containing protein [Saprospirales bacterium]